MSLTVATFRPRAGASQLDRAEARERSAERRVGAVWCLLVLNALTFYPGESILHIPSALGKLITQGALPVALLLALTVNRRVMVRPNVVLCLVSLLVLETARHEHAAPAPGHGVPDLPAG